MDIEGNLQKYLGRRDPTERYASFDYCFNYFQEHKERNSLPDLLQGDALELSCLHLGFYLASWGMLRGSSRLLQQSARALVPVIEVIANAPSDVWEVDADAYGDGNCPTVFQVARRIEAALPSAPSATLTTKVMLGTFGCVPAFDTYFKQGFGTWTFGPKSLRRIGEFYSAHSTVIERNRVETLDFRSGQANR